MPSKIGYGKKAVKAFKKLGLKPAKAKKMLNEGRAKGKKLTPKQKRFFGLVAGKRR